MSNVMTRNDEIIEENSNKRADQPRLRVSLQKLKGPQISLISISDENLEPETKSHLIKCENAIELLPRYDLRHGDLPLIVVAGHNLRRVVPQLVLVERPAGKSGRQKDENS
ncbi:hypothetical protein BHM03_00057792 [Ensete ventricosum]|nr:hypothetical protein BHM03_00057792 [Ensete ventricosum]